ncbi:MAG: not-complex component [Monoraphidium minutum]|nr:MAG: not-complex component [Monoraphidium minutum]
MAAQRKLQQEIDRCLKRVQEGIDEFDGIWEKVHDTDNSNQKEKFEADLKKEIKKLQRLRDQIKTWISSADVKDKTQLVEARKAIEREMERFKTCEKEAKLKAFSKAALGQADKLDPREQAKIDTREWINSVVDSLNEQIEKYEYEIEELAATGGKKKSKPPPRIEFLQTTITVHKKHIIKLEAALRCLDNDALEAEDLDPIRDSLEYYLEDAEHADNVDDLYADIAETLEAVETVAGPGTLVSHGSKGGSMGGGKEGREGGRSGGGKGGDDDSKDRERERERAAAVKAQLVAAGTITKSVDDDDSARAAAARPTARPPSVAPPTPTGPGPLPSPGGVGASPGGRTPSALQLPAAARSTSDSGQQQQQQEAVPPSPQQRAQAGPAAPPVTVLSPRAGSGPDALGAGTVLSPLAAAAAAAALPGALRPGGPLSPSAAAAAEMAAAAAAAAAGGAGAPAAAAAPGGAPPGGRLGAWMSGAPASAAEAAKPGGAAGAARAPPPGMPAPGAAAGNPAGAAAQQKQPDAAGGAKDEGAEGGSGGAPAEGGGAVLPPPPAAMAGAGAAADALADGMAGLSMDSSASGAAAFEVLSRLASQDLGFAQLPAAPVGVIGGGGGQGLAPALGVLDASFRGSLPQPVDSDWARSRPRHPVATPPTFPRVAPDIMSAPGLFRRMDPEALFFAFYYQPDSYQQYLAAQELKRQSWRYHKHHNAWFQRYAEPSVTNDEYEQGTYVYFDFNIMHDDLQTGWCYRRKENFTFRYDALEDELAVAP